MLVFSVRGFKSCNLIGPFPDVYSRIVRSQGKLPSLRTIRDYYPESRATGKKQVALSHRMAKECYLLAWKCSERPREDVDGGLT